MDKADVNERGGERGGSTAEGEPTNGESGRGAGPAGGTSHGTVATDTAEHSHGWASEPEHAMTVETTQIREGPEASGFGVLMVPVEYKRGSECGGGAGSETDRAQKTDAGEDAGKKVGTRREGERGQEEKRWPWQQGSRYRVLLISGAIALVSGFAGAWGYSHFFNSSDKGGEQSASKSAGSTKNPGRSKGGVSSRSGGEGGSKGGSGKAVTSPPE